MALVRRRRRQLGPAAAPGAQVLGWDALRRLAAEGVALAPHTRTHPKLDRLADAELAGEVAGSLEDLRREIGDAVVPAFAYPAGGVSAAAAGAVAAAGYRMAFTTRRGANDLRTADPLRLSRINVGRRTKVLALRAQLALPARKAQAAAPARRRPRTPAARIAPRSPTSCPASRRSPRRSFSSRCWRWSAAGVRVEVYPLIREKAKLMHPEAQAVVDRAHYLPVLSPAIAASQVAWLREDPRAYLGALRDVVRGTLAA